MVRGSVGKWKVVGGSVGWWSVVLIKPDSDGISSYKYFGIWLVLIFKNTHKRLNIFWISKI